jgi:hypothetical protein
LVGVTMRAGHALTALTAVIAAAALLATACTTSHKPDASSSGPTQSAPAPGPTSGATGAATAISTATAASLSAQMSAALDTLHSAHLDVDAGGLGGKSTVDVTFAGGKATATDLTIDANGQPVEVRTVGDTSYAKLPPAMNKSGKPWILVTSNSSNAVVQGLTTSMGATKAITSLDAITALVGSAQSVQAKGTETVGGVSAAHYALQIDASKGSSNPDIATMLTLLGDATIPVDVWLDGKNRPVKLVIEVPLAGQKIPVTVLVGNFDAPLSLPAPPADQVATS